MCERWLGIKNFPEYKISNLGRVKSFKRSKPYILIPVIDKDGYLIVTLRGSKIKNVKIHRLVCSHFIYNPLNKPQVNHINGIKSDNSAKNLEWVYPKENTRHAFKINKMQFCVGSNHHLSKFSELDVKTIKQLHILGSNKSEIAKHYGVSNSTIGRIINNKTWRHL